MKYLHTMVRVRDLAASLDFYVNKLGMTEIRRNDVPNGRFTLVFLCAPEDEAVARKALAEGRRDAPMLELTFNYDPEDYGTARNFGHLAYEVDDIYATCERLQKAGVTINLLQKGAPLPPREPWASMPNTGAW